MNSDSRIFVAGHRGLVCSAIVRELQRHMHRDVRQSDRSQLDLRNQAAVDAFFQREQPAYVFLAAAKVGCIHANNACPADVIRDSLKIQTNVIDAAWHHGTRKPISEDAFLTGPREPTNESYAIATNAGIKMCPAYRRQYGLNAIVLMPTNLYGPDDNVDLQTSHVLPA